MNNTSSISIGKRKRGDDIKDKSKKRRDHDDVDNEDSDIEIYSERNKYFDNEIIKNQQNMIETQKMSIERQTQLDSLKMSLIQNMVKKLEKS